MTATLLNGYANGHANGHADPTAALKNGDVASLLPREPKQAWAKPVGNAKAYRPDHPGRFHVVFQESARDGVEAYSSKLVADRDYAPGEQIAPLDNISTAPVKAYSSVQFGPGEHDHFELNSDLLFMNHSCAPTAEMRLYAGAPQRWEVVAGPKGIKSGEDITFFYPSTEWDMAQGFECSCGAADCLGQIRGAKYLTLKQLEDRGLVNEHIRALKAEQA